jgi:hypothetical protein
MKFIIALPLLVALYSCSNDGIPDDDIAEGVHPESYGVQLPEFKLVDRELKLHWLQEYVTGYGDPSETAAPAAIQPISLATNCSLPKPAPGSMLAHVVTDHGKGRVPFYAMDAASVDYMGKQLAAMVKMNRNPSMMLGKTDGLLYRIDVIVTETSKPVHLVLASRTGALWNIQTAPGVRLSAVTLISQTSMSAVANLDAKVPVSAMTGDIAKQCGAIPAVEPVNAYPGLKMQIHKDYGKEKKIDTVNAAWRKYNTFFTRVYGLGTRSVSVGANALYHAAVGPVPAKPEDRIAYKGLEGATIRMTPATLAFYGSERNYAAARRATAIKSASRTTGGNFEMAMEQAGY